MKAQQQFESNGFTNFKMYIKLVLFSSIYFDWFQSKNVELPQIETTGLFKSTETTDVSKSTDTTESNTKRFQKGNVSTNINIFKNCFEDFNEK